MLRQVVTCDHCNAEVQGEPFYATPLGKAFSLSRGSVHACSKEHLGYAVAKAMGVPVDGAAWQRMATELGETTTLARNLEKDLAHYKASFEAKSARVDELEKALNESAFEYGKAIARIANLEAHAAALSAQATQYKAERDHVEETCRMHSARVIDLEKRIEEQKAGCETLHAECERLEKEVVYQRKLYEEAIDNKPTARCDADSDRWLTTNEPSITDTTKPTKPAIAEVDHVHELGSCTHCDTTKPTAPWAIDAEDA